MENLNFNYEKGKGFILTDFPYAEKVIKIEGKKVQELADLALHNIDIQKASECLDYFNKQKEDSFEQMIFWKMSIIYFMKCFGKNNARKNNLNIEEILGKDYDGIEIFEYFKDLRDKNIAHDDNSLLQCLPSAVINRKNNDKKIAKIICLSAQGEVSSGGNINNLKLLISQTSAYIIDKFDRLSEEITEELEKIPYEELIEKESSVYNKPKTEDMGKNRSKI